MKITDKWVLKELDKLNDGMLRENIECYPEDERDGRSDIEVFADEVSYLVSLYHGEGHILEDEYKEAKKLLRETQNGKIIPISASTFRPLPGYNKTDIEEAMEKVRIHDALRAELRKLQKRGVYGAWYQL